MWERLKKISGVQIDREPVAVVIPEPARTEVVEAYRRSGETEAVRVARRRTSLDLLSAVRAVRALAQEASG